MMIALVALLAQQVFAPMSIPTPRPPIVVQTPPPFPAATKSQPSSTQWAAPPMVVAYLTWSQFGKDPAVREKIADQFHVRLLDWTYTESPCPDPRLFLGDGCVVTGANFIDTEFWPHKAELVCRETGVQDVVLTQETQEDAAEDYQNNRTSSHTMFASIYSCDRQKPISQVWVCIYTDRTTSAALRADKHRRAQAALLQGLYERAAMNPESNLR